MIYTIKCRCNHSSSMDEAQEVVTDLDLNRDDDDKVVLTIPPFVVLSSKKGMLFWGDMPVYRAPTINEKDGVSLVFELEKKLPVRPRHPRGYRCVNCWHWDKKQAYTMMTRPTHQFANGSYNFNDIVVYAQSNQYSVRKLDATEAGWCPKHHILGPDDMHACKVHYMPRPWWVRVINWFKRG